MPSVKLAISSTVLVPNGWVPIDSIGAGSQVLGVNRHGQPSFGNIAVNQGKEELNQAFIGSAGVFGEFVLPSLLLDASGTIRSVKSIVDEGLIGSLSFESLPADIRRHVNSPDPSPVWCLLEKAAARRNGQAVALRRRSATTLKPAKSMLRLQRLASMEYIVLKQDEFAALFRKDWMAVIRDLGAVWLTNGDDEVIVERHEWLFGLWYLAAIAGKAYKLRFDSMQHTAAVAIADDSTNMNPIQRGLTAFTVPRRAVSSVVAWSDPSWNLISSGFVLAGQ